MNLMINSVKVEELKSIDVIEAKCKNLNIITGINSSGKSTMLQAILLFAQINENITSTKNGLNGSLVSLGEFRENKNMNTSSDKIIITVKTNISQDDIFELSFSDEDYNFDLSKNKSVLSTIKYLSCNRIGARDVYAKNYADDGIGINGESAIHYLEINKSTPISDELIKDTNSLTLSTQVNYWLNYIMNASILTEDIPGTDIVKASYRVGESKDLRPKNVGSGISYVISILILCLASKIDSILIIENPEMHLHPKAQSRLCEFLYFISNSGRQLFIETHSDHIFNGIRAGIATDQMKRDNIVVNFFFLNEKKCTQNEVVEFGAKGQIKNYQKDLFDQFDNDLDKILGLG